MYHEANVQQSLYRPRKALTVSGVWGFQISWQSAYEGGKVVSPLPHQKIFLVLISIRSWVYPTTIVRPEGLYQRKIPKTPSRIEPATFRLVAPMDRQTMDNYKRVTYNCNNTFMTSILHGHLNAQSKCVEVIIIIIIIIIIIMFYVKDTAY